MITKREQRERRHARIRAKVRGSSARLRISVFKSNRSISAQLIDDDIGRTLVSAAADGMRGISMTERARSVGRLIAERAKKHSITRAIFDRSGYQYTGAIKALADGAREGGLEF